MRLTKPEFSYQSRPLGKQSLNVTLRPHLNLQGAIPGIPFLNDCDGISSKATARDDDQSINLGRPKFQSAL